MVDSLKCWSEEDRLGHARVIENEIALLVQYGAGKLDSNLIPFTCCGYNYGLQMYKVNFTENAPREVNTSHLQNQTRKLCGSKGIEVKSEPYQVQIVRVS